MSDSTTASRTFGLDAFTLKIIMALLMLLDHMYIFLPGFPRWFDWISRMVAPAFCFFVTEGLVHTRSRPKYLGRMYAVGGIMFLADFIFMAVFGTIPGNSIIMAFAVSASAICAIDEARVTDTPRGKAAYTILAVLLLGLTLVWEGSILIPAMALPFYYLRKNKWVMCGVFAGISLVLVQLIMPGTSQWLMITGILPILLYNGKRGRGGTFSKWFFYVFYPTHIWILFLLGGFAPFMARF